MKRAAALLSTGFLGASVALGALVLVTPDTNVHRSALLLGSLAMAIAAWLGRRWYDLDRRVTTAILVACVAFAVRAILVRPDGTLSSVALASAAIGTGLLVYALVVLALRRGMHIPRGTLLDAIPIALAAWLLAWITFIHPLMSADEVDTGLAVLGGLFVPIAVVLVYLTLLLLSSHGRRPMALVLLCGAAALDLLGVIWRLGVAAHGITSPAVHLADGFFVASFFVGAAAFVHPSMALVERHHDDRMDVGVVGRLVLMTGCLALPVFLTAITSPGDTLDRWARGASTVVLIVAVVARIVSALGDLRRTHEVLLEGVQTDPLTLLPNHHYLQLRINDALNDIWRTGAMPAVCFVDIDRFRKVNDKFGRATGDEVLRLVGQRLRAAAPPRATVCRLAVDEFVVLDPLTHSIGEAHLLAESLLAALDEPFRLNEQKVFISASIGVAQATVASTVTAHDLIGHAETAKTRAQEMGAGHIVAFTDAMQERVERRLSLELALPEAVAHRELHLVYQPILELDGGRVVGFEALMRWTRPDGTSVPPVEFIPIAEQTGAIVPLGTWALLEALTALHGWIERGQCPPDATVSVNVSPRQLADPNFPAAVNEALQRSHLNGAHLWLEITESVMIADTELALATLQAVRELGVRIALDDFGTGYSSLSLVQQFPLHRLKIDRHFVHGLVDNPDDRQLVETIIAMGRSLGLDLVAEGVETIHQLRQLRRLGCDHVQGFLISKPNPPEMIGTTVASLHQGSLNNLLVGTLG